MVKFLTKRLIGLLFVIIGVTFITFIMGYFAPGDPIRVLMGEHYDPVTAQNLRHAFGLDLPWYQQYFNFLIHLTKLDFGNSFYYQNRSVWDILKDGVPISAELGLWALSLQLLIGVPLGIFSALKANSWIDTVNMGVALVAYAIPVFIIAILCQILIVWLDHHMGLNWPATQWGVPWHYGWSDIQFKLVPILVYAAAGLAYFARLARTSMLEVLRQDYVRTARAKGLVERVVVYRHAFRNAMIPLVTVIGFSLGFLVTGAFFIENIFAIPGIARITISSINNLDYPVVQATTVLLAVVVVFGNLLSDILYTVVDPRIKAE
ncbi:ABC transporter permease [Ktedonosporobacter rubrisoli]|uniref:ABC transporter permease n=1 Tax=Ktedonosporobacter rubrisoli TaxID=2509675 RepID=A0A4P6K1Y5_KTERU|nr:ABC transporter permease [Ktedonosporobacter rubrisoli]QBD82129.1 ABC transporter permease [Ktedonosporobacter rubrisoli]